MKIIIVDDEPLARARLRRLLSGQPDVEIAAECPDGPGAVEAVRRHAPDLLLLDVQMPGMDGFETLRALDPAGLPAVVFVTGFDQHAVRAFEARALDYLLKPTSRERLAEALARVRERLAVRDASPRLPQALLDLLAERAVAPRARRLAVRTGERVVFVATADVDWVEAAGNYAILHVGRATHIIRETMSSLEEQLSTEGFLREPLGHPEPAPGPGTAIRRARRAGRHPPGQPAGADDAQPAGSRGAAAFGLTYPELGRSVPGVHHATHGSRHVECGVGP